MKLSKLYYILLGAIIGVSLSAAVASVKPEWTGNYYDGWREGIQFCDESQSYPSPANPAPPNPTKDSAKKPIALALKP